MITYSTNWMGPISLEWYKQRGLVREITTVLAQDTRFNKAGETVISTEITEYWSSGRIDVGGNNDIYGLEIALPVMKNEDWINFSAWLHTFETEQVWTLAEIVAEYEKTNPAICWYDKSL